MRDLISWACTDGHHQRCTGWMVVPDFRHRGNPGADLSVACRCPVCEHPPIPVDLHFRVQPQKGATYGVH